MEVEGEAGGPTGVVVPPQDMPQPMRDFRHAALGPRGYKHANKRKNEEYQAQAEAEEAAMEDDPPIAAAPLPKRQKLNTEGVHKVSGKRWKEPGVKASSLRSPKLSVPWEKKMALKEAHKRFQEVRLEAVTARKDKLRRAREQREDAKKRRVDNQQKARVVQLISNPATLKRMQKNKKLKKKLVVVDTVKV